MQEAVGQVDGLRDEISLLSTQVDEGAKLLDESKAKHEQLKEKTNVHLTQLESGNSTLNQLQARESY